MQSPPGGGYRINSQKRTEMRTRILLLGCAGAAILGGRAESALPLDLSGFRAGAITLEQRPSVVHLCWPDERNRQWCADFDTSGRPEVIRAISLNGVDMITGGRPVYWLDTGERRGGWDQF